MYCSSKTLYKETIKIQKKEFLTSHSLRHRILTLWFPDLVHYDSVARRMVRHHPGGGPRAGGRSVRRLRWVVGVVSLLEPVAVPPSTSRTQQEHQDHHQPVVPQLVEVEVGGDAAPEGAANLIPRTAVGIYVVY